MAFEAELTTSFAKVAAQGERLKNSFKSMNDYNRRSSRDYLATLEKAERVKVLMASSGRFDQRPTPLRGIGAEIPGGAKGRLIGAGLGSSGIASVVGGGPLAAGAMVFVAAASAIAAIDARRVELARQAAQWEQKKLDTVRTATRESERDAKTIGDTLGKLYEVFGARGMSVPEAKNISKETRTDLADVMRAMIAAQNIPGMFAPRAMQVATAATSTGEVTLEEAIASLSKNLALQMESRNGDNTDRVAARIIAERRGLFQTTGTVARIQRDMEEGRAGVGTGVANFQRQRDAAIGAEAAVVDRFESGGGLNPAMEDLFKAVEPVSAALVEMERQQKALIEVQKQAAASQWGIVAMFKDILETAGMSEGSERMKLRRETERLNFINAPGR